jgi:hypothetical protein
MKFKLPLLFLCLLAVQGFTQDLIPGYRARVSGEDLVYHSPQPDAKLSLLVRSEDSTRFIEWQTAPVPAGFSGDTARFLMLAGIDVNPGDPHAWRIDINGSTEFIIRSPVDTAGRLMNWQGIGGGRLEFRVTEVDKYGDFMGYLFLHLPAALLEKGSPLSLRVTGETAGSRTWFMVFQYEPVDRVGLTAENAVEMTPDGNKQLLRFSVVRYQDPVSAMIYVGDQKFLVPLEFGYRQIHVPVREIVSDTLVPVKIVAAGSVICDTLFPLSPVARRTIFLLHHSHNDIGYTHVQDEVERMQWEHLRQAAELAAATKDYPEGARFKWNTEVMWAVVSYLEQADAAERLKFTEAVKNGQIELHGLYANELVSLCEAEELMNLMEPARRICRESGVPLTSAMITDIPGWSWGLVPALALSGVKYLSLGTNTGHRIGNTIRVWGDRPFYWVSPSGEEKVLCWIHEKGYSHFHTGLDYRKIQKRLHEDLVFDYLNELASRKYPYEYVMLRYTIGSDNGPVDEFLPEAVKEWNERYVTPRIVISTVGEAFSAFEERYGKEVPEVRGDFTAYWEDGAYSTARETVMNRASAVRLNQAQLLHTIRNSADYPDDEFREAWKNVLLYDEHTWGSWNSISEPESDFTLEQWAIKESFARKAHQQSSLLLMQAMPVLDPEEIPLQALEVVNTCNWSRTGLVSIPSELLPPDPAIVSDLGETMQLQRLSDGQYVFLARDVPALSSARYSIMPGVTPLRLPDEGLLPPALENDRFSIEISETTGAIEKLFWKPAGIDLVAESEFPGLGAYLYVEGRHPENAATISEARVMKGEEGPLVRSFKVISKPPGCRKMITEITLITGTDEVLITQTLDKRGVYTPEAVHFAFPFNIPGGVTRYDLAFGHCEVESGQVPGSNRNFITLESWADVSNAEYGVTIACPDASIFQSGKIRMDAIVTGWEEELGPSSTFISYAMNNYWETNFAAAQEGIVRFTYILQPHRGFDPAASELFGMETRYPLLVIPSSITGKQSRKGSFLKPAGLEPFCHPSGLILVSLKPARNGGGNVACLFNSSEEEIGLFKLGQFDSSYYLTDPDGIEKGESIESLRFRPGSIRFVLVAEK